MTLRVREEQLRAFQPVADLDFVERTADYLRAEHAGARVRLPEGECALAEIPGERLLGLVGRAVARARRYRMTWESSLTAFAVLMFTVAPNFDSHPLIRRVLTDASAEPDERLDQLWEHTTEENWQAAADNYDPASWDAPAEGR